MTTEVRVTRTFGDGRVVRWHGHASKITDSCLVLEGGYIALGHHEAPDLRWSMTTTYELV
jgi:hypothetical protein